MNSKRGVITAAASVAACLLLIAAPYALAADSGTAPELGWGKLLEVLAALGLILGIIYLLAFGLRRFRLLAPTGSPVFTVVGSLALGTREKLYLVQVGQEQLVVGSSMKGLEALHVMRQNVEATAPCATPLAGFDSVLAQFSRGKS